MLLHPAVVLVVQVVVLLVLEEQIQLVVEHLEKETLEEIIVGILLVAVAVLAQLEVFQ